VNRTPAIIGFLVAGALILIAGFLAGLRDDSGNSGVPPLSVLAPADGDSVRNPVALEFVTPAALRSGIDGWTADDLHLHLMVDDVELMPAAADITPADSAFVWRLPPLDPGSHRLYLTWAGRHHGNLQGRTDTIRVIVLP
jgi:hypothetical protein